MGKRETLPILLVYWIEKTSNVDELKATLRQARQLGWLPIWPGEHYAADGVAHSQLDAIYETFASNAEAALIVGDHDAHRHTADRNALQRQLEAFAHDGSCRRPVYGTVPHPTSYPPRLKLAGPPFQKDWTQAALAIGITTERLPDGTWAQPKEPAWGCATCHRHYGVGDHAERIARWCCSKSIPCEGDGCSVMIDKNGFTLCRDCQTKRDVERYAKRKRKKAEPGVMVYSDSRDEWFADLDAAVDESYSDADARLEDYDLELKEAGKPPLTGAERALERQHQARQVLEDMRLLVGEPVVASEFDLGNHVCDDLPNDSDDDVFDRLSAHVEDEVAALNAALASFGTLCWTAGDEAVLLEPKIDHTQHGRGTEGRGHDDPDCPCRPTGNAHECAEIGCGFCRAEMDARKKAYDDAVAT